MHRNQHHNQNLETVTVPPGNETGWYYIVVANLSHSTTWKDLKAFAEQACEVDHAEVYPPTSGFVRVRGLANFEKAFKHLDGNTLEYRALQADARNRTEPTVVKLPRTDYHFHAARSYRGETKRVFSGFEAPSSSQNAQPEPFQGPGTGTGNSYLGQLGTANPEFSIAPQPTAQWSYATPPAYTITEGHQVAPTSANLTPPGPVAYQAVPDLSHGYSHQLVTSGPPSFSQVPGYQAIVVPASGVTHSPIASYPYGVGSPGYTPPSGYDGQAYVGYFDIQLAAPHSHSAYPPGYGEAWSPDLVPTSPPLPGQIVNYGSSTGPSVVVEQRKIFIRSLKRDGLTEAAVVKLLAECAGIGAADGEIERVELRINNDGRARGTAFVTFGTAELASAAIAALNGREVAGKKLSVRLAQEGVSQGGGYSSRPGRRRGAPGSGVGSGGNPRGGHARGVPDENVPPRGWQGTSPYGQGPGVTPGALSPSAPASAASPPPSSPSGSASPSGGDGSQRGGRKDSAPVVVDGNGGRRKKEQPPVVVDGTRGNRRSSKT